MSEFEHEFVDEFFANFVREFKYEIRTNSYQFFARKIGYVTNGLLKSMSFPLTVPNRTSNMGKDFSPQSLEFYSLIQFEIRKRLAS